MDVELLVVRACPHEAAAAALLRGALDDVGLGAVEFGTRVVADLEEAADLRFVGSPTFLVDGKDPFAEPGGVPALACRVFETSKGPAGIPEIGPLRQALMRAAQLPAGQRRCGCCGLPRSRTAELGSTPGVFICAGCALWAARRAAGLPRWSRFFASGRGRRLRRHVGDGSFRGRG